MTGITLWLVRHGHTEWHGGQRIAGRTDVALSARGRDAVRALVPSLARHVAASGSADTTPGAAAIEWWASPLSRTLETARLLRAGIGLAAAPTPATTTSPLRLDARLMELDFGEWEGSTWDAVHRDDGTALAAWGDDWVDGAPSGGESFRAQAARCGKWLDERLDERPDRRPDERRELIVVAHHGTLRALLSLTLGHALEDALRLRVDPAGVCRLEHDGMRWLLGPCNARAFE